MKNMWIKQRCNGKIRDFTMALRARKVFGAFERQPPGLWCLVPLHSPPFLTGSRVALTLSTPLSTQSLSLSFVPLGPAIGKRELWEQPFWNNKGNNQILVSRSHSAVRSLHLCAFKIWTAHSFQRQKWQKYAARRGGCSPRPAKKENIIKLGQLRFFGATREIWARFLLTLTRSFLGANGGLIPPPLAKSCPNANA